MPPSYLEARFYCARNPPLLYHCGHCFFPAVLNSLRVIRITFNFRFVLYLYSFSKDMLAAQQARSKDKITEGRRANLPSKLPPSKKDRLGSLSNDGGDSNENVKKSNVSSKQNNSYAFWYISLPSARLRRELS